MIELVIAIAFIVFPWKSREIVELILSERLIHDYRESDNTKDLVDTIQINVSISLIVKCLKCVQVSI